MKLNGQNASYDAASGAFLVQQTDEVKMLAQVIKKLDLIEEKLNVLAHGSAETNGREMDERG